MAGVNNRDQWLRGIWRQNLTGTYFDFFGMSATVTWASVLERREYALVVLVRLEEFAAGAASSSEIDSGSARFLPLGSFTGSLMVTPAAIG